VDSAGTRLAELRRRLKDSPTPDAVLELANALRRLDRDDEVAALVDHLGAIAWDHVEARRLLDTFPAWRYPEGDPGRRRALDVSPLPPRVSLEDETWAFPTARPLLAEEAIPLEAGRHPYDLLATPWMVAVLLYRERGLRWVEGEAERHYEGPSLVVVDPVAGRLRRVVELAPTLGLLGVIGDEVVTGGLEAVDVVSGGKRRLTEEPGTGLLLTPDDHLLVQRKGNLSSYTWDPARGPTAPAWSLELSRAPCTAAATTKGIAVADEESLWVLDPGDGAIRWSAGVHRGEYRTGLAADAAGVLVARGAAEVAAYDWGGELCWVVRHAEPGVMAPVFDLEAVTPTEVVVHQAGRYARQSLEVFDRTTGAPVRSIAKWDQKGRGLGVAVAGDRLYSSSVHNCALESDLLRVRDAGVAGIDPDSWSVDTPDMPFPLLAVLPDEVVLVGNGGELLRVRLEAEGG
jgi:hypothetical protein